MTDRIHTTDTTSTDTVRYIVTYENRDGRALPGRGVFTDKDRAMACYWASVHHPWRGLGAVRVTRVDDDGEWCFNTTFL